jgi:hypothetical protein
VTPTCWHKYLYLKILIVRNDLFLLAKPYDYRVMTKDWKRVPTLTELILKETDEKLFRVISHFFGPKLLRVNVNMIQTKSMLVDEEPEKINVTMRTFKDEKILDSLEAYSKHILYPVEPKGSKTDPKVILCVYVVV